MADLLLDAPIQHEPLKKNRFTINFPDDIGIQKFMLLSCDLPKPNINSVPMPFMNTETYVKGIVKWQPQNMVLRDFIGPSTSQAVMEWFRSHYESATGRSGYAVGYKKNIEIDILDPTGVAVTRWLCEHCMLVGDIDFGNQAYGDDGVKEISFTIQPDSCEQLF